MMASVLWFAVHEMQASWDEARWKIPLGFILLMMRQKSFIGNTHQITLQDMELIDQGEINGRRAQTQDKDRR